MDRIDSIIIGIAARNESGTIVSTLESVSRELEYFPRSIQKKIVIVLNGCTDNTESIVKKYVQESTRNDCFLVRKISGNLIDAQQLIWKLKGPKTLAIFVDADIVFYQRSLRRLFNEAKKSKARVLWSTVVPKNMPVTKMISLVRILNFRDYFQDIFKPRRYLCGRVFCTKEYRMKIRNTSKYKSPGKKAEIFLDLKKGPIVDDIYLTRYFRLDYGIDAISNVHSSVVYFNPITSLSDFYKSQRRTIIEMYRLGLLYPEKISGQSHKTYLSKNINSEKYQRLSLTNRVECKLYLTIYWLVRNLASIELKVKLTMVGLGVPLDPINVWPSVKSTKIS